MKDTSSDIEHLDIVTRDNISRTMTYNAITIAAAVMFPPIIFAYDDRLPTHVNYNAPKFKELRGKLIAIKSVYSDKQCNKHLGDFGTEHKP